VRKVLLMRKAVLALTAVLFGTTILCAQSPVEQLPAGEQVSGWAVEAIPIGDQGPSRSQRMPPSILKYAGDRGIARFPVSPDVFSSTQFNQATGALQSAFNGRAFLRVTAVQRYAFIIVAVAHARMAYSECELAMQVGGRWIINDRYVIANQGRRVMPSILNGAVDLQPGIYPVEFVTGCPHANDIGEIEVAFTVRGERDASPRKFGKDELFHVLRQ